MGRTLGMVSSNHAIVPSMTKVPYDPLNGLTPISVLTTSALVLCVTPTLKANSVAELIALAKSKPGDIKLGSSGVGTITRLAGEYFASAAGISWLHVPYKGNDKFATDLIGGNIDVGFFATATAISFVKSGKMRALAVTTPKRVSALPDVATVSEQGVSSSVDAWVTLIGPPKLPAEIVARLEKEVIAALAQTEVRDKLAGQGVDPVGSTAAVARETFAADIARYARIAKDANIMPE